jgi:hypothetical protein
MMNKLWPLLLLVIPYQSIHAQEVHHAPTVEQCRADQRLWLAKLEQSVPVDRVGGIKFGELVGWKGEMLECNDVDPEFHVSDTRTTR